MNDFSPSILDSPLRRELGQLTGRPLRIVDNVEFASPVKFEELSEAPLQLIPTNSTTPSVLNLLRFKFQNTVPITVTNFIGGQEGQHIMVIGDGNTTITHGTQIFNTSGANLLLVDNRVYSYLFAQGAWREQGGAPVPNLSFSSAALTAITTLINSGTWYDSVSLSLSAGTWLVNAHATFQSTHSNDVLYGLRLSNGTNHFASTQRFAHNKSPNVSNLALTSLIPLISTTTIRLQGITDVGGSAVTMRAATSLYPSGNTATIISAVRVA